MDEKTVLNLNTKQRIGARAASLVRDGESIILDSGSTTLQMVPWLAERVALTVMTNSLHIMNEAAALDSNVTLLMPGGTYRKRSASFHGSQAEQAFSRIHLRQVVHRRRRLRCRAGHHHLQRGISGEPGHVPGGTADHRGDRLSKFGRKTPNVVVPIDKIDIIITDKGISDADRQALEQHGIQVVLV